tara:strand:+ start:379 stop:534 length:156 start_codon:yes stop_codon:yes gene_type:complete
MTVVDVDIEEVDDRVEMLKETIESLEINEKNKNKEMFKIVSIFVVKCFISL